MRYQPSLMIHMNMANLFAFSLKLAHRLYLYSINKEGSELRRHLQASIQTTRPFTASDLRWR